MKRAELVFKAALLVFVTACAVQAAQSPQYMPLQTKLDESDIDLAAQNFQFKMLRIYSLILLLPALSVCVFAQSKAGIREVDFKNRTFPFTADTFADLPRRIRVRNGLYHSPHQEPGMTYTYFKVAEVVFGDLTGDGRDEAAVVAIYGGATSDTYKTNVYLYAMSGRRPELLAVLNQKDIGDVYERLSHENKSYLFEAVEGGTTIE